MSRSQATEVLGYHIVTQSSYRTFRIS